MAENDVRLADLLAALSVVTDLGMGQPPEKAIRSCVLATALARVSDVPEKQVRDVYLTTLLRHLGCTATAADEASWFGGDELVSRPLGERADFGDARESVALVLSTGRGSGIRRPGLIARAVVGERRHGTTIQRSVCEAGALLVGRLGLGPEVRDALYQLFERWDGKGVPQGLAGDDIALPVRIGEVANQAVIFHDEGGVDAALAMVERRSGGWFDPAVADTFRRHGADLLRELDAADPWDAVLSAEPQPVRYIGPEDLDRLARTFADMIDLKSTYTLGHSAEVAELAERAARSLGLADREITDLRRAALLHDLGRAAVSSGIWDKKAPLTRAEREQIRMHPYYTERILAGSSALKPLARIAGLHHERLDGSGYHHGLSAASIPVAARILGVADTFQTATQRRPHRPARSPEQAAELVAEQAAAGGFDPDCVKAVVGAAGRAPSTPRTLWPSGLTDREVEVLRLVARGHSNKQIADQLVISARTAEHHVQHIYTKIGTSTRAAAALFAMEHGLLRS
ncbi:MAG TPA: HD domain-containing phosphohydrolase [Jiangellaceae bacterium]